MQFWMTSRSMLRQSAPVIPKIGQWSIIQYYRKMMNQRQPFASFTNQLNHQQDTLSLSTFSNIIDKPKRPLSVFLRYVKLIEPEIMQEFPEAKRSEIMKIASERYKHADDEVISNLRNEFVEDLETYDKIMQIHKPSVSTFHNNNDISKRPPPVFLRYVKLVEPELNREFPEAKRREIIKIASERYKSADYKILSNLRNEYVKDVKTYEEIMQIRKPSVSSSSDTDDKPKKPLNIFFRYLKLVEPELNREFPEAKRREIIKIASERYKSADDEILSNLQNEYVKDVKTYEEMMQIRKPSVSSSSDTDDKPIRPLNIFFRYLKLVKPELNREFPEAKRREIIKIASERYKSADDEILSNLQNEYVKDMKTYEEIMQIRKLSVSGSSDTDDKPKRPPPVFIQYVKLVEPELNREFPEAKRREIIKIASERYKNAADETLSDLRNKYVKDLETYHEMVQIHESKEPRKPRSVFSRFAKLIEPEVIRQNPDATKAEIIKLVSEKYKQADEQTIENLRNEYCEEKEQYHEKMIEYESNLTEKQKHNLQKKKHQKLNRQMRRDLEKLVKPKRPRSAFLLFLQSKRLEGNCNGELEKNSHETIANEWRNLPEEEKRKYIAQAEEQSKNYKIEQTKWELNLFRTLKKVMIQKGDGFDPEQLLRKKYIT